MSHGTYLEYWISAIYVSSDMLLLESVLLNYDRTQHWINSIRTDTMYAELIGCSVHQAWHIVKLVTLVWSWRKLLKVYRKVQGLSGRNLNKCGTTDFINSDVLKCLWRNPWRAVFRYICKISKSDCKLCHVCLSVHPHGTTNLPLDWFSWNLIFEYF
jgi:hypothetical protein